MKYNIHIYQQGIVDAGLHHQTDLTDWAIIDYIKDFFFSSKTRKVRKEDKDYVWLNYRSMAESLPLCPLQNRATIKKRMDRLSGLGLIELWKEPDNTLYVRLSAFCVQTAYAQFVPPCNKSEQAPCSRSEQGLVQGVNKHNNNPPISSLSNNQKENISIGARPLSGASPQTPSPSSGTPDPLPGHGKSIGEVGDNGVRQGVRDVVGVWAKRLSLVPGVRGPSQMKRRQWAGELEQWVKEDGGITCQEILDVLIFAMEDPFWRGRIISPKSLRRNWDTLVSQRSVKGAEAGVEEVLNEFGRAYESARGKRYIFQGKDRIKARELLNQMGKEEIIGLFGRFFEIDDSFLDKQGRSFSCFAGQINRLRGSNSGDYYIPFEEFMKAKRKKWSEEYPEDDGKGGIDGKGGNAKGYRDGEGVVGCNTVGQ